MKKAIELLSLVNECNVLNVYLVISKPAIDVFALESIAFKTFDEAQEYCDFMNNRDNTTIYKVFETCMHI